MVTQCPECKGTLSTAATQCPHCGAPVRGGQLAGTPPMATPVAAAAYPAPQPGHPAPQPGYAPNPGHPAPAAQPPQKGSSFVRNCLLCSCLLVVILIGGSIAIGVSFINALKSSFVTTPAEIKPIAQQLAPGIQTPPGYVEKFGLNVNFMGTRGQGVFLGKTNAGSNDDVLLGYGAMSERPGSREDFKKQVKTAIQNKPDAKGDLPAEAEEEPAQSVEEEFTLGSGEKVKLLKTVSVDKNSGKKVVFYIGLLDPFPNEFGWLGVFALGPEESFDHDALAALMASIKTKK